MTDPAQVVRKQIQIETYVWCDNPQSAIVDEVGHVGEEACGRCHSCKDFDRALSALSELEAERDALKLELEGNGMENKGLRRYYAEAKELSLIWKHESDKLQAERDRLKQELEDTVKAHRVCEKNMDAALWKAEAERDELRLELLASEHAHQSDNERLREAAAAFSRYGDHDRACDSRDNAVYECTCGLGDAVAAISQPPNEQ